MRRFLALVVAGSALALAAVALAADTDRVPVLPGLNAAVTTLPEYVKTSFDGDAGGWRGPRCDVPGSPSFSRETTVTWGVGQSQVATAEEAMNYALTFEWPVVERGTLQLRHVIRGREVGTVPAAFVVTDSGGDLRQHESALAVQLTRGRFVAAKFWSAGPAFKCNVGSEPEWAYHRRIARAALQQVVLEGSLPPARVLARRSGRRIAGSVHDAFGRPVVGIAVVLERRVGRRWQKAASGRSGPTGAYSLRAPRAGLYRAVATVERISARSAPVRMR